MPDSSTIVLYKCLEMTQWSRNNQSRYAPQLAKYARPAEQTFQPTFSFDPGIRTLSSSYGEDKIKTGGKPYDFPPVVAPGRIEFRRYVNEIIPTR